MPATDCLSTQEALRNISVYLMERYNWLRSHQYNGVYHPPERKIHTIQCPELIDHYEVGSWAFDVAARAAGERPGGLVVKELGG